MLRILSTIPPALLDRALAEQENFGNFDTDRDDPDVVATLVAARLAEPDPASGNLGTHRLTVAGCILASQVRAAAERAGAS